MKHLARLILLCCLCIMLSKTQAQQKHFIYIESADKQAFAVVLNGKVYSSSDYGYVIVPKLIDGTYNFTVSFPMNKFPDQSFKCIINKKDIGYKLQNNAGKDWSLQNMQTQKILTGNGEATDNAFSNMLSDVVNDSNLANKNLPVNNVKPDTVAATANKFPDTTAAQTSTQIPAVDTSSNITAATYANTPLQKISETKLDTGTNMVFVDKTSGADTIKVFVPSADSVSVNNNTIAATINTGLSNPQSIVQASNTDTATLVGRQASSEVADTSLHAVSNPFYKASAKSSNLNISKPAETAINTNENINKPGITNAVKEDCSNMISDNDMDKIKRKMFVQNNDNDMVQTALKLINNKCITIVQVKTLGNIFSSDDGRYNLYEALYKHTYDYGSYASLESQIIDPYYKKRFEVMLR